MTLNDSDSDGIVDAFATAAKTAITASTALGGSAPDATNWETGDFVEDSDNAGSVWFIYDDTVSGGARRVDPGSASNPITETVRESIGVSKFPGSVSQLRNDLVSGGNVVAPRSGVYTISSSLEMADDTTLILRSGVTIQAAAETAIEMLTNTDTDAGNHNINVYGYGGVIDGNEANQSDNFGTDGIFFKGVNNLDIRGVRVHDIAGEGIQYKNGDDFDNWDNWTIAFNEVLRTNKAPIKVIDQTSKFVNTGQIVGNYIDAEEPDQNCIGISVDGGDQVLVALNQIKNVSWTGIEVDKTDATVGVFLNTIENAGTGEVETSGHRYDGIGIISGNVGVGFNSIIDVHGHGIHVWDDSNDVSLTGNRVVDPSRAGAGDSSGIYLNNDSNCQDNHVTAPNSTPDHGIEVTSNASDVELSPTEYGVDGDYQNAAISNSGTRTQWDSIIGGGPLGGVDISTVIGASAGDRALTTGASAAAADVIAVFDGTDWVYPTRGGAVTPA
jgi:hypothetical protein